MKHLEITLTVKHISARISEFYYFLFFRRKGKRRNQDFQKYAEEKDEWQTQEENIHEPWMISYNQKK